MSHLAEVPRPKEFVAKPACDESYCPAPDHFWVADFGDENLNQFVRATLEKNRDIKTAKTLVQIAANNARIVGADIYPTVDLNLDNSRQKQNFTGIPIPGLTGGRGQPLSVTSNNFRLYLEANWEVDIWGLVKAMQSEAIAEMEASQFDMAALQLSIAAQAVKGWFLLAEAREQVELAESTLKTFRNTEATIRDRFERGIVEGNAASFGSQLLLAETDVAVAEDALAARRELLARTARQLEILAGEYPCGKAGNTAQLPSFPKKQPILVPCSVLLRRPDLLAAERRLAAADQRLAQANRAGLPTLSLTTAYGTNSDKFNNLLDGDFSIWSLAGDLAQPIFRAGILKAGKNQVLYEIERVKTQYEQAILIAFSEVENALSSEKFLADRIIAITKAAELSKESYTRAGEEYANGTGDLLTMLTAQRGMFNQQSQLITLRRQQLEARVDLHLALAGSFECPECIETDTLTP